MTIDRVSVPVDLRVLQWLLGEGEHPETGQSFERPYGAGAFWWRKELRAAMGAPQLVYNKATRALESPAAAQQGGEAFQRMLERGLVMPPGLLTRLIAYANCNRCELSPDDSRFMAGVIQYLSDAPVAQTDDGLVERRFPAHLKVGTRAELLACAEIHVNALDENIALSENAIHMLLTRLISEVRQLEAAALERQAGEGRDGVPPRWYTQSEIEDALRSMKYCDDIVRELAPWFTRHLTLAFNKGHEIGSRAHPSRSGSGE